MTTYDAPWFPKPLVVANLLLLWTDGGLGGNLGWTELEFLGGNLGGSKLEFWLERLRSANSASTSCKGVAPLEGSTVNVSSCLDGGSS